MFVVKNAWKSVTRNKGRNILVIIIVTIIAIAATIGLSIRQAATTARNTGLENTTVTAQISLDREKLISESRNQSNSSESDASDQSGEGRPNVGGMDGGKDFGGTSMVSGDFSLVGFSSDEAVSNTSNGSFTMVDGKVFGYDKSSDGDAIISKSLADFNALSVGDTISVADPNDTDTTYQLTIVGIYKNSTDSNLADGRADGLQCLRSGQCHIYVGLHTEIVRT